MKSAPIAALAALCLALLCSCAPDAEHLPGAAPSAASGSVSDAMTVPTAAPETTPAATENPAGEIHRISNVREGFRYEYSTFSYQPTGADPMAMGLLTVLSYPDQTAQPLCHRTGCAHDSPDCAAWLVPDGTRITLAADGDTLYLLHEDVDGGAWLDARSLTDDSTRILCALPQMECDREYQWELAAADGAYLYLNAASYPSRVDLSVPHEERAGVMSVSKTDGTPRLYENRETSPADNPRPEGMRVNTTDIIHAEGRSLYLWLWLSGGGGEVWRLEPDTGLWTMTARYIYGDAWQEDDLSDFDDRIFPAEAPRPLPGGPLVHADEQAGTLSSVDAVTGQERLLCSGLPQAAGRIANYAVQALPDWYVVTVGWLDWTTQEQWFRQFLVPAAGGDPVELSFFQYSEPRGNQSVYFMDQYGGQFYCQYEIGASAPIPALDKDGMPYTYREYSIRYGLLSVEDALAGRANFVPLYAD